MRNMAGLRMRCAIVARAVVAAKRLKELIEISARGSERLNTSLQESLNEDATPWPMAMTTLRLSQTTTLMRSELETVLRMRLPCIRCALTFDMSGMQRRRRWWTEAKTRPAVACPLDGRVRSLH